MNDTEVEFQWINIPTENPYRKMLEGWDTYQWVKGKMKSGNRFCLIGRAMEVGDVGNSDSYSKKNFIVYEFAKVISDNYPDSIGVDDITTITKFNDSPHTTFKDVQAMLEKAAVRWDEQHA